MQTIPEQVEGKRLVFEHCPRSIPSEEGNFPLELNSCPSYNGQRNLGRERAYPKQGVYHHRIKMTETDRNSTCDYITDRQQQSRAHHPHLITQGGPKDLEQNRMDITTDKTKTIFLKICIFPFIKHIIHYTSRLLFGNKKVKINLTIVL